MPGNYIKEVLESRNISQAQLAKNMAVSRKLVSYIISGKSGISANTALGLEDVLGISSSLMLRKQANYDLFQAKKKRDKNKQEPKSIHDHEHYILSWGTEEESPKFSKEEFETLDEAIARAIILNNLGTSCPNHIQDKDGMIFINGKMLFEMMDERQAGTSVKAAE